MTKPNTTTATTTATNNNNNSNNNNNNHLPQSKTPASKWRETSLCPCPVYGAHSAKTPALFLHPGTQAQ
jgi:hypothetical protein